MNIWNIRKVHGENAISVWRHFMNIWNIRKVHGENTLAGLLNTLREKILKILLTDFTVGFFSGKG